MVLTLTITNLLLLLEDLSWEDLLPLSVGLEEQGWDFVALQTGKFKGDNDANPWGYCGWIV